MSDCIKRQSKANDESLKQELRRFKNREAARRVRERKSNQLNTYKSQVDELKRENQKLLQIIQQLQEASLSGPCIRAVTACEAGTHCLPPDMSLAPDSLESTPSAAAAAAIMAAAVAAGASSSPANLQGLVSHPSVSNHHQQPLSSPWGLASATAAGASPLEPCNSAPASDPACVMSQPGLASAMYSSTALLPATISAPLMGTLSLGDADCVLLQRACGCTGEEECDECEGVRVTLCNSSSLPVVTTPGPKPKRLTLDDLKIPVAPFASDGNLLCPPSPISAATEAALLQQAKEEQQRQQALLLQGTFQQQLDTAMDMDLVETLEPSRPGQHILSGSAAGDAARFDAHVGSGNMLLSGPTAGPSSSSAMLSGSNCCYIRRLSCSGEPGPAAAPLPPSGARVSFLDAADTVADVQGKQKLRRHKTTVDTASAAAALLAATSSLPANFLGTLPDDPPDGRLASRGMAGVSVGAGAGGGGGKAVKVEEPLGYVVPCSRTVFAQLAAQQQQQQQEGMSLDEGDDARPEGIVEAVGAADEACGATAALSGPPGAAAISASRPLLLDGAPRVLQLGQVDAGNTGSSSGAAAGPRGSGSGSGKSHKGHSLLRSIAASVKGLMRSSSGGMKLNANSVAIAAAAAAGSGSAGPRSASHRALNLQATGDGPAGCGVVLSVEQQQGDQAAAAAPTGGPLRRSGGTTPTVAAGAAGAGAHVLDLSTSSPPSAGPAALPMSGPLQETFRPAAAPAGQQRQRWSEFADNEAAAAAELPDQLAGTAASASAAPPGVGVPLPLVATMNGKAGSSSMSSVSASACGSSAAAAFYAAAAAAGGSGYRQQQQQQQQPVSGGLCLRDDPAALPVHLLDSPFAGLANSRAAGTSSTQDNHHLAAAAAAAAAGLMWPGSSGSSSALLAPGSAPVATICDWPCGLAAADGAAHSAAAAANTTAGMGTLMGTPSRAASLALWPALLDMPDHAVFDSAIASIAESMASMDQEGLDAVMQLAMQEGVLLVD